MKRLLIAVIIVLSGVIACVVGNAARTSASLSQEIPKESKEQPKRQIKLGTDSLDDKYGEVKFDHEAHTIKNHTPEGKTNPTCVTCHHTDQPNDKLTSPFAKSERNVVLTADVLKDAAAPPVKGCRSCHLQAVDDSQPLPVITRNEKKVKVDNEDAYHMNCRGCHDDAIKARPDLAMKIAGSSSKGCLKCHVAK
jgi:nitrate/TMAO reductase-like tetraheme cytochrome c subunit